MKKSSGSTRQGLDDYCDNFKILPLFHQIITAHELTLKRAAHDLKKLESPLSAAMVDLNPHQVDAALFAFKSPMSRGAILCDEVGLGKTIEAGLVISQLWAEGKRKIIAVVPAPIRQQWQNELREKFDVPGVIVDGFEYRASKKNGKTNPFKRNAVVIVSIPFAYSKSAEIAAVGKWDLVVIDEAHRLRNVYKKSGSKQARTLKKLFAGIPKLLLTATPLQNSLMELYGLVSFIEDKTFGSEYSFRKMFLADNNGRESVNEETLKERISGIAVRTLRRQVQEYVRYTNRLSMVEDFTPTDDEAELYELVSEYLRRPDVAAINSKYRHLLILVFWKILASSSFAIAKTLNGLINNINKLLSDQKTIQISELLDDVDGYEEESEEIAKREDTEPVETGDIDTENANGRFFTEEELEAEKSELIHMRNLAESIQKTSKGDALLIALDKAFAHCRKMGWHEKAVIFTESRRTQEYLFNLLSDNGYKELITVFNGSNNGVTAKRAYDRWVKERPHHETGGYISRAVAIRDALIHEFHRHTRIFLTTEAGAEGINLQFCNLVINFDLPWNPQRIEQRVGRCHRYGQKYDVIALNFLNRKIAADCRVYELLDQKFRLFSGLFGASDEILGSIGSGVDFEKRILDIYQSCRTDDEINKAFDKLQAELAEQINKKIIETRSKLLENFDDEVRARFKVIDNKIKQDLSALDIMLAKLIISSLCPTEYKLSNACYLLKIDPAPGSFSISGKESMSRGYYYVGRHNKDIDAERLHLRHPMVKDIINNLKTESSERIHSITLCYTKGGHKVSQIEPYLGKSGFWAVYKLTFEGIDTEDHIINVILVKKGYDWIVIEKELADKFSDIQSEGKGLPDADMNSVTIPDDDFLNSELLKIQGFLEEKISRRNEEYYERELDKLEIYSEEILMSLHESLQKKETEINDAKKKRLSSKTFEERRTLRKEIHKLEKEYSRLADKIAQEKKKLFQEKETEMKRLDKKLKINVSKICIAKAGWKMV